MKLQNLLSSMLIYGFNFQLPLFLVGGGVSSNVCGMSSRTTVTSCVLSAEILKCSHSKIKVRCSVLLVKPFISFEEAISWYNGMSLISL